jgi:hypothetical protein
MDPATLRKFPVLRLAILVLLTSTSVFAPTVSGAVGAKHAPTTRAASERGVPTHTLSTIENGQLPSVLRNATRRPGRFRLDAARTRSSEVELGPPGSVAISYTRIAREYGRTPRIFIRLVIG